MKKVDYKELCEVIQTGCFTEVRGPKPSSYEFQQAKNGLNDKKLWTII